MSWYTNATIILNSIPSQHSGLVNVSLYSHWCVNWLSFSFRLFFGPDWLQLWSVLWVPHSGAQAEGTLCREFFPSGIWTTVFDIPKGFFINTLLPLKYKNFFSNNHEITMYLSVIISIFLQIKLNNIEIQQNILY